MKSIRLSLIVYFLVLLAAALGAVSWLAYQSSAQTLQDKVESQRKFLAAECATRCQEARSALDRRLLQQAQTLAGLTRSTFLHVEGLSPVGLLGTAVFPQGHLAVPLWLSETFHPPLAFRLLRLQPLSFFIESAEDVMPAEEDGQPREYFQTYRLGGQPLERSASMGASWFTLAAKVREEAQLLQEHYDQVELEPGVTVRRVTLKVTVPRFRPGSLPPLWRFLKPPALGKASRPPSGFFPPRPAETEVPVIFFQYASDTAPLAATLAEFQAKHDQDLQQLEEDSRQTLAALRQRLLVISLATFAATVAGGFWLIRLGLVPLQRLSEAVSRVSARNFQLPIDRAALPHELQPIAGRLAETLQQLQRAFTREKQAATDISHELRTPLAALLTTIDVALRKPRSPAEYRQLLEDCRASGQHMNQLVERLLALARLDAAAGGEKGVRNLLCEAPSGPSRQKVPDPFFPATPLAWLGEAVAIKDPTAAVFRRQSGANLLLIGQDDEMSFNMMVASLVSLSAQLRQDSGDGLPSLALVVGTALPAAAAQVLDKLPELLPIQVLSPRDLPDLLNRLAEEVDRRQQAATAGPPLFLALFGVQRLRDLRKPEDDFSFGRRGEGPPPPAKQLAHLAREGPPLGVHILAWCDTLSNLNRVLDRQGLRDFEMRVLLQMSAADSSNLIDSPLASRLGAHRALYYTEDQGRMEKFRPYGLPELDWLQTISSRKAPLPLGERLG